MMKLLAVAALGLSSAFAGAITIYNTGVDNTNTVLSGVQTDSHWTLSSSPIGAGSVYTVDNANPIFAYWNPNGPTAQWVSPTNQATDYVPTGDYTFSTTFSLAGYDPTTGSLSGIIFVDNVVKDILINGVSTGITGGDFVSQLNFTINCGANCNAAMNTLAVVVTNTAPSPVGLKVTISGTATELSAPPPSTGVPEPTTYAMLAAGLGLFGLAKANRKQAGR